jgi:hypothetical protein
MFVELPYSRGRRVALHLGTLVTDAGVEEKRIIYLLNAEMILYGLMAMI